MNRNVLALIASFSLAVFTAGCGSQPALDPKVVAEYRTTLTMAEEPDGAQTVLDVRKVMLGEDPAEVAKESAEEKLEVSTTGAPAEEHADHDHEDGAHEDADHAHEHADHDHETGEHAHADHDHADHDHADHDHAAHDHAEVKEPVISELDVVLVGTVGGVPNPSEQSHPEFPFAKRQALFFLADPAAVEEYEEHQHKHAPGEECAFCSAHAADAAHLMAAVQFNDKNGKPLAVDARELFDLKEKETVVIRGKAKMTPTGMLTVDADGLYVRR